MNLRELKDIIDDYLDKRTDPEMPVSLRIFDYGGQWIDFEPTVDIGHYDKSWPCFFIMDEEMRRDYEENGDLEEFEEMKKTLPKHFIISGMVD